MSGRMAVGVAALFAELADAVSVAAGPPRPTTKAQ
jgi:hypothetical protein